MLRILNTYEHYLLVNLPEKHTLEHRSRDILVLYIIFLKKNVFTKFKNLIFFLSQRKARYWKQHFLVGLQLSELRQCLQYRQKVIIIF